MSSSTPRSGSTPLAGAVPSPNIWFHPETYELENRSVDRDGVLERAIRDVLGGGWTGLDLLDLGCGTGFHLPRWADQAQHVYGVEPHPDLARLAVRRTRRLANVTVLLGTAQRVPLPDASVDVMQARWAYFLGPGCEPGLGELDRVMRPGSTAFVIDNDSSRSTFGSWFRRAHPTVRADAVQAFWAAHGWQRRPLDVAWTCSTRADLEACARIELGPDVAAEVLASHDGTEVDYAVDLWWRGY